MPDWSNRVMFLYGTLRDEIQFTAAYSGTVTFHIHAEEASCNYNFEELKLEEGNKKTTWSPAPEDVDASINLKVSNDGVIGAINLTSEDATINASKINLVGAVSANSIVSGAVTTDKLAAKAATIDKIDTASLTAAQAFVDDFNANIVNTKRLNVAKIVADGIAAQTIDAQSATISNLNVVNATVSGYFHASVIGYNASTVNNGLVNGCLLVGAGNFILPTLPHGKCVEYTLFNPQFTRVGRAQVSGQGANDKFISYDDDFAHNVTSYVSFLGYHKFIGIGDTAPNGGTLWVYN